MDRTEAIIEETLALAVRRVVDKARDLKLASKTTDPLKRIAALEAALLDLLAAQPAALLAAVLQALRPDDGSGAPPSLDLQHPTLLAAFDRMGKQLVELPAQRLGRLSTVAQAELAASRQRLKKAVREGRVQLKQRLARHSATVRKHGAARREEVRATVAAAQRAEKQAQHRARAWWLGLMILLVGSAVVLWWRRA